MRSPLLAALALVAAGCVHDAPTPPTPPPPPTPPATLANRPPPAAPTRTHRLFAVVSRSRMLGECTNMGGEHYVFEGEAAGRQVVLHAGGHGVSLGLLAPEQPTPRWFVAEVTLGPPAPARDKDLWLHAQYRCAEYMPPLDGEIVALVPAADRAAAEALREQLATTEPTASGGLVASPDACIAAEVPAQGRCPLPGARITR